MTELNTVNMALMAQLAVIANLARYGITAPELLADPVAPVATADDAEGV